VPGNFPGSLTDTEKKKKNKQTKVRAVPGNCPDRRTDEKTNPKEKR
jgi:hypothetical protein